MFSPERLRELMEHQGRRSVWLAEQTEYRPETVARFMTGAEPISEKFAIRAAKALQVPVDWLREPMAETAAVA